MRAAGGASAVFAIFLLIVPAVAHGQDYGAVGTRAQGMGGAFVGLADDASAVYWNPAGLAGGAYFSLLVDGNSADGSPDTGRIAGRRSGWIVALSTPALGLSYYRLRNTLVRADSGAGEMGRFRLQSLVTHHGGVTLVQSLADGIAVGATAKLIRGVAASVNTAAARPDDLLEGWDVLGQTSTKLDVDVGIMATGALGSLGLTVRNISGPSFKAGDNTELQLEQQIRGGASILLSPTWKLAADADLTESQGPLGAVREVAVGAEGQITRRLAARAGVRVNTAGDRGRAPGWALGGSYAVLGSLLVDAHATTGSDETVAGWGIAGRVVF